MHVFLELLSHHGNKKPGVVLLGHKTQQPSQTNAWVYKII
jgi:hypothetical protein